jgi:hypothetical protein
MGQVRVTRKEGERLEEENMVARRSRAPVKINLLGCLSYEQGLVLTYSEENMNSDRYAALVDSFIGPFIDVH